MRLIQSTFALKGEESERAFRVPGPWLTSLSPSRASSPGERGGTPGHSPVKDTAAHVKALKAAAIPYTFRALDDGADASAPRIQLESALQV